MKKLLILMLFLSAAIGAVSQSNTAIEPTVDVGTLGGYLPSYFVDTATAQTIYGIKTFADVAPKIQFIDTDTDDNDVSGDLRFQATATGTGAEDVDFSVYQQIGGTLSRTIFSDADQGIWLYPKGESANPVSITTGGAVAMPSTATLGQSGGTSGQINFVASDADAGNIAINTNDYLTFNGFTRYVFDNGMIINETKPLFLDGGSDVYLSSSGDVLNTFVGGTNMLTLTEAATDVITLTADETDITGTATENGYDIINTSDLQSSLVGGYYNFDGVDDKITVADNADLNFGTGDFSFIIRVLSTDLTSGEVVIFKRANPGDGNTGFIIKVYDASAIPLFRLYDGGSQLDVTANSTIEDNKYYSLICVREDGIMKMYINGVLQTDTEDASAYDISNTDDLDIGSAGGGDYLNGQLPLLMFFNRALTATEALEVSTWDSQNPPIWFSDVGASQTATYTSDFSAGVDGWASIENVTVDGNIDAIGGEDNWLRSTNNAVDGGHRFRQAGTPFNGGNGKSFKISFDYYIPSTNASLDGFDIYIGGTGNINPVTGGTATLDAVTSVSFETTKDYGLDQIYIFTYAAVSSSYAGNGDVMYIKNMVITQIGNVANYNGSGIASATWYDNSGNDLDGTVTGATSVTEENVAINRLLLPLNNNAANPTLAFGDGNTGFYESSDNTLKVAVNGVEQWVISPSALGASVTSYAKLQFEQATNINPVFVPDGTDVNTGIGWNAADQLSLIAGGTEMIRLTEDATDLIALNGNTTITSDGANPTLTLTGGSTNITTGATNEDLEIDPNGTGEVVVTGGLTSDNSFGELYDPSTVISTAVTGKYYTLSGWTGGQVTSGTLDTDSTILVEQAGTYLINFSMSFTHATNSTLVHISAFNSTTNTEFMNIEAERLIGNGGDLGNVGATGMVVLAANDKVCLRTKADKTGNLTIGHGNFNLIRIK